MHHVAIMRPSLQLLEKIVSKKKIIESRWYSKKTLPWNKIHVGDTVFLKIQGR